MGKKQHQKDKLYITNTEWKYEGGGFKGTKNVGESAKFRRLPFYCCSLSMQPFEHPLCTMEGVMFDLMNIVPFLKKYGVSPVTGEKMLSKDLIKLKFHKNSGGKYHCPVTFKIFNENTNIVTVKPTGNVYAYEAIEKLNLKTGHLKDLLTDEAFTRKDIITLQDPTNLDKFNLANFYHIKNNLKVDDDDESLKKDPKYHLKNINAETRDVLTALAQEYKPPEEKKDEQKRKLDKLNAATYSTGRVAASFTSTAVDVETEHVAAMIDEDVLRYARVKKKGYVRLITNYGLINLELHCEMVPKTCENFMKLCSRGYYNGTVFHRLIRNFMLQGGDPTATGKGGESIWGQPFKDEFKPNLTHSGRGILSMANSGPMTNTSQFFITFRSARHLDNKHTVFGRVVGGLETLGKVERIEVDKNDKPSEEIKLEQCVVFVDPYDEADEMLAKERAEDDSKAAAATEEKKLALKKKEQSQELKVFKSGVGKYINSNAIKRTHDDEHGSSSEASKKKKSTSYHLKDFSSW